MEFAFPWPVTQGEWLAWSSAAVTVLLGLMFFFAPRLSFKALRLQTTEKHPEAVAEGRATMSGFYLGLGLSCILLTPQPFLYMALGFSWLFTAFGRLVSILSDRGNTLYNWVFVLVDLALAALPLAFVFGFLP
jgi:cytochrome c biogenesis protein CcdA